MEKEIQEEQKNGTGGPSQQQEVPADPNEYPPVDNTIDNKEDETQTPDLDKEVERYSSILNRR